jgi:hypothetical protein
MLISKRNVGGHAASLPLREHRPPVAFNLERDASAEFDPDGAEPQGGGQRHKGQRYRQARDALSDGRRRPAYGGGR